MERKTRQCIEIGWDGSSVNIGGALYTTISVRHFPLIFSASLATTLAISSPFLLCQGRRRQSGLSGRFSKSWVSKFMRKIDVFCFLVQVRISNPDEESYDLMVSTLIKRLLSSRPISDQSDFLSLLLARGESIFSKLLSW